MKTLSSPLGTFSVAFGLSLLTLGVATSATAQQNYNPKSGGQIVSAVEIQGVDRINTQNNQIGFVGVEQCSRLKDKRINFRYKLNPNAFRNFSAIEFEEANLLEFNPANGLGGDRTCTREGEQTVCTRINDSTDGADFSPPPNPGAPVRQDQWPLEATIDFDVLLSHHDSNEENCTFEGDDRLYALRLFLNGFRSSLGGTDETNVEVDGPIFLDRTRPPAPSNVSAAATENILKVQFDPPSDTGDIQGDDYHVFFSNSPLNTNRDPEELADSDAVTQSPLSSISEEDGTLTGEATKDIDQTAGESLYVAVASQDRGDNFSDLAQTGEATSVQQSIDFWELYLEAGGAETGGCACNTTDDRPPASLLIFLVGAAGLAGRRHLM